MINLTDFGLDQVIGVTNSFTKDSNTENINGFNQSELDQVTTMIPRRNHSKFPPRLLQLLKSLRRECQDKLSNQPILDSGNLLTYLIYS